MSEQFIGEGAASEFLGVSRRTLQRWRVEPPPGGGPRFFRLGGRVLYRRTDLTAWAETHSALSTSERPDAGC